MPLVPFKINKFSHDKAYLPPFPQNSFKRSNLNCWQPLHLLSTEADRPPVRRGETEAARHYPASTLPPPPSTRGPRPDQPPGNAVAGSPVEQKLREIQAWSGAGGGVCTLRTRRAGGVSSLQGLPGLWDTVLVTAPAWGPAVPLRAPGLRASRAWPPARFLKVQTLQTTPLKPASQAQGSLCPRHLALGALAPSLYSVVGSQPRGRPWGSQAQRELLEARVSSVRSAHAALLGAKTGGAAQGW